MDQLLLLLFGLFALNKKKNTNVDTNTTVPTDTETNTDTSTTITEPTVTPTVDNRTSILYRGDKSKPYQKFYDYSDDNGMSTLGYVGNNNFVTPFRYGDALRFRILPKAFVLTKEPINFDLSTFINLPIAPGMTNKTLARQFGNIVDDNKRPTDMQIKAVGYHAIMGVEIFNPLNFDVKITSVDIFDTKYNYEKLTWFTNELIALFVCDWWWKDIETVDLANYYEDDSTSILGKDVMLRIFNDYKKSAYYVAHNPITGLVPTLKERVAFSKFLSANWLNYYHNYVTNAGKNFTQNIVIPAKSSYYMRWHAGLGSQIENELSSFLGRRNLSEMPYNSAQAMFSQKLRFCLDGDNTRKYMTEFGIYNINQPASEIEAFWQRQYLGTGNDSLFIPSQEGVWNKWMDKTAGKSLETFAI